MLGKCWFPSAGCERSWRWSAQHPCWGYLCLVRWILPRWLLAVFVHRAEHRGAVSSVTGGCYRDINNTTTTTEDTYCTSLVIPAPQTYILPSSGAPYVFVNIIRMGGADVCGWVSVQCPVWIGWDGLISSDSSSASWLIEVFCFHINLQ